MAIAASATGLEEVVVQGERVVLTNPGLAGFYERREQNFGRYLTQEEIEQSKGYDLRSQLRRLRVPFDEPVLQLLPGQPVNR